MPKKELTSKQLHRLKQRTEYIFLVGVELFSRFAFVYWRKVYNPALSKEENKGAIELDVLEKEKDAPITTMEAQQEELDDDGLIEGMKSNDVVDALKKWFKEIKDLGYDLNNFVSDEGSEFKNVLVNRFLNKGGDGIFKHPVQQVFTVANDRVKNPVAERFIGTFKRLFGQYTTMEGRMRDITQKDIDKIVDFYNSRVHSSTGYTPDEVLKNDQIADTLFEIYRYQKAGEVFDFYDDIKVGDYVRVYYKYRTPDKNIGDKKSNVQNFSYTIFKVSRLNKADNMFILDAVDGKDERDKFFVMPSKRGLRKELLLKIDYNSFQKYNAVGRN